MGGAPTGGTTLTIEGRGFLNLQQPPTVWIGEAKALDVRINSNTQILCLVPPGLGWKLSVSVTPSAKFYPGKPIAERTRVRGPTDGGIGTLPAYLEVAGETTTLETGYSYDG